MKTIGSVFSNFLSLMDQNRMKCYYHDYDVHPSFKFGDGCYLYGTGKIVIGERSYMGRGCSIYSDSLVSIGKNVCIGHNVRMYTSSRFANQDMSKEVFDFHSGRILIDDYVWMGLNVYIGPNVHIGANSVIGANCVITKDVGPNMIVKSEQITISKKQQR
jgi:maltose O-acetyltransferase